MIEQSLENYDNFTEYGIVLNSGNYSNTIFEFIDYILEGEKATYSDLEQGFYCYNLNLASRLNIQNLNKAISIEKIANCYIISYETINGEIITIEYLQNGTSIHMSVSCYPAVD